MQGGWTGHTPLYQTALFYFVLFCFLIFFLLKTLTSPSPRKHSEKYRSVAFAGHPHRAALSQKPQNGQHGHFVFSWVTCSPRRNHIHSNNIKIEITRIIPCTSCWFPEWAELTINTACSAARSCL